MKKFQLLLLDAGPVIKLFETELWDLIVEKCDIAITRTVAEKEAIFAQKDSGRANIDLRPYEDKGLKIIDVDPKTVSDFFDKFDLCYKAIIDDGEKETLAFLANSPDKWTVCSSDAIVYKILAHLNKAEQGISLEELLHRTGLSCGINWKNVTPKDSKNWKYSKAFREKYTREGQIDSIQNKGLK